MEKNGFVVTSGWIYCYSSINLHQEPDTGQATIAKLKDKEIIRRYLKQSQIFKAAENYAHLWRWYHLDLGSGVLQNLIHNRKIIITTNHDIQ